MYDMVWRCTKYDTTLRRICFALNNLKICGLFSGNFSISCIFELCLNLIGYIVFYHFFVIAWHMLFHLYRICYHFKFAEYAFSEPKIICRDSAFRLPSIHLPKSDSPPLHWKGVRIWPWSYKDKQGGGGSCQILSVGCFDGFELSALNRVHWTELRAWRECVISLFLRS